MGDGLLAVTWDSHTGTYPYPYNLILEVVIEGLANIVTVSDWE